MHILKQSKPCCLLNFNLIFIVVPYAPTMDNNLHIAHIFRSELLDKFACIERNVLQVLEFNFPKKHSKNSLGIKLKELRKLLLKDVNVKFDIDKIFSKIETYSNIRSTIVHSKIEKIFNSNDEQSFIFRNIGENYAPECYYVIVLDKDNMKKILRETGELANEFKQLRDTILIAPISKQNTSNNVASASPMTTQKNGNTPSVPSQQPKQKATPPLPPQPSQGAEAGL